jgi:hypothetical protein
MVLILYVSPFDLGLVNPDLTFNKQRHVYEVMFENGRKHTGVPEECLGEVKE